MILKIIQARGSTTHVHLTPQEVNAIWHLTQAIGRAFWHMTSVAQCIIVGVPGAYGIFWLHRWNPLENKEGAK